MTPLRRPQSPRASAGKPGLAGSDALEFTSPACREPVSGIWPAEGGESAGPLPYFCVLSINRAPEQEVKQRVPGWLLVNSMNPKTLILCSFKKMTSRNHATGVNLGKRKRASWT